MFQLGFRDELGWGLSHPVQDVCSQSPPRASRQLRGRFQDQGCPGVQRVFSPLSAAAAGARAAWELEAGPGDRAGARSAVSASATDG